jgi:hypothetical protein
MEQSFGNENTCDAFMNEVIIENEMSVEFEEMVSLQIEGSRNSKMNEKNFKKLHAQKTFWRGNSRITLCWAFYCVNDNKEVNAIVFQTMWFILCHNNPILNINPKTKARKGLIIYDSSNHIVALRKHVNLNHLNILKKFEEKINCPLRGDEKQPSKKRPKVSSNSIISFFVAKKPFKKDDVQQKRFLEDLIILIVKNHLPL